MGNHAKFAIARFAGVAARALSESAQINWLVTVRPRVGYVWDNWLVYATGGWAFGKVAFTDAVVPVPRGGPIGTTIARDKSGWTAGAGVEYGIAGGWSAKLEYLYVDLGSVNGLMGPNGVPSAVIVTNHDLKDQIVRVGINYRCRGNSEVVVRYP